MIRANHDELPANLVEAIDPARFLFAYALPERGRYVARHVRPDGRTEELEYDVALGRALTIEERRRALPAQERTALPAHAVTVVAHYSLDEETAKLRVALELYDGASRKILGVTKEVYDPTPWQLSQLVAEALKEHRFPAEYAAWASEQKVAYWAMALHRWRRANGECGADEDEIYTPELVRDMERLDPRVRDLVPAILALVGRLEQTAAEEALAAFAARTGWSPG